MIVCLKALADIHLKLIWKHRTTYLDSMANEKTVKYLFDSCPINNLKFLNLLYRPALARSGKISFNSPQQKILMLKTKHLDIIKLNFQKKSWLMLDWDWPGRHCRCRHRRSCCWSSPAAPAWAGTWRGCRAPSRGSRSSPPWCPAGRRTDRRLSTSLQLPGWSPCEPLNKLIRTTPSSQ